MEWLRRSTRTASGAWRTARLLARCGAGARLVVDSLLACHELVNFHLAAQVADLARDAVSDALAEMINLPLWAALQDGLAAADARCLKSHRR